MPFTSRELCLRVLMYPLVFVLCQKTGHFSGFFFKYSFSKYHKKRTSIYKGNQRHSSLHNNVVNTYVKFQFGIMHSKRDIYVQKIKVPKIIFRYIPHSLYSYNLHIIRKASYSSSKVYSCNLSNYCRITFLL